VNGIVSLVLLVLFVVLGALYCFGGYRFLKIVIFVYALFAGFTFVYHFLAGVMPDLETGVLFVVALVAGLILGVLSLLFVKFAIFLAGGLMGYAVFSLIREFSPAYFAVLDSGYIFLIGLICFIVFGVITLAFQKHLLIFFTAIFGGYSLVYSAGILIGVMLQPAALQTAGLSNLFDTLGPYSIFNDAPTAVMMIPVAVFAILGIIAQYRFSSRRR
jgi:hypothetical protein